MTVTDEPVSVVGAGPARLAAAIELARQGVIGKRIADAVGRQEDMKLMLGLGRIRALTGTEPDGEASIRRTDASLGIGGLLA